MAAGVVQHTHPDFDFAQPQKGCSLLLDEDFDPISNFRCGGHYSAHIKTGEGTSFTFLETAQRLTSYLLTLTIKVHLPASFERKNHVFQDSCGCAVNSAIRKLKY